MSHILKSLFSTSAKVNAAERISRAYKDKIIGFFDKAHQNPADWKRMMTFVDAIKPTLDESELVECLARGSFHPRRPTDPVEFKDRLTVWLLDALSVPKKAAHVNKDGTQDAMWDVPEKDQPILAAKIAAAQAAAEAASSSGSSTPK